MDAILYIQAAREELVENQHLRHTIEEANKASFRPPHPSHASTAQQDWDDAISPV
jgi:methylphosphotriester-DNA--protein-cysteine methyltransferase